MTYNSCRVALRAAVLSFGFGILASACSSGGGSSLPSGSSLSTSGNPTSTSPISGNQTAAPNPESSPATGTGNSIASPPGLPSVSSTSQRLDASKVAPLPAGGTLAYSDTFESDAIGSQPAGWSLSSGSWSVCQQVSHEACATSSAGDEALAGNTSWTNYHIDALVVDSDLSRSGVAVLGRVQDSTHFYQLELRNDVAGSSRSMWYIWKYDGRSWTDIGDGPFATQSDSNYRLRFAFNGAVISAFVAYNSSNNFQALGSGTDTTFTSGKAGLRSWGTGSARFDDVRVTLDNALSGPTPHPAPTNAPAQVSGVATYAGCSIFTPGDYYNADVSGAAVDPHSANYIASVTATDNTGFFASTGINVVNIASSNTTLYSVHPKVSYHAFNYKQPWQNGYYIQGAGDAHSMVLLATPPACHLYELYNTTFIGNVLSAYSGATWDLSKPFMSRNVRGSAMASGLSFFAGMVKNEEIPGGIHHALNFGVYSGSPCRCYVAPATTTDGLPHLGPSTAYELPYGAHLRLKASFDDSHFGPQAKAITEAMKRYGMYLSDTGGHYTNNNALYTANPSTGGGSWNESDLRSLNNLRLGDFDVLTVGTVTSS